MNDYRYVILGGGTTAGFAAREFVRQNIGKGDLCIVSAESILPMNRPPFSKQYLRDGKPNGDILINDEAFYQLHGIDIKLKTCARSVELHLKQLKLDNGETLTFDKLLIATGSSLRHLDVEGGNLQNIFYLRNIIQSDKIREKAKNSKYAVIVGGGFIGCETAATLRDLGLDVTIVLQKDHLLSGFADSEIATFFDRLYKKHGIKLLYSNKVLKFHGDTEVEEVELATGKRLKAELVVIGVGVEPNVKLFEGSDLVIGKGIQVNDYCETGVEGIYAAGDVVEFPDPIFQKMRHVEHWENALEQGAHAARTMSGIREPYVFVPYFFSDFFNLSYDLFGDQSTAEDSATRGKSEDGNFSHWWFEGNHLVAAFIMSPRPDEEREKARFWIRNKIQIDKKKISDENVSLSSLEFKAPSNKKLNN